MHAAQLWHHGASTRAPRSRCRAAALTVARPVGLRRSGAACATTRVGTEAGSAAEARKRAWRRCRPGPGAGEGVEAPSRVCLERIHLQMCICLGASVVTYKHNGAHMITTVRTAVQLRSAGQARPLTYKLKIENCRESQVGAKEYSRNRGSYEVRNWKLGRQRRRRMDGSSSWRMLRCGSMPRPHQRISRYNS